MRILLDIDGTIASWDSVAEHGFGPGTRPYDARVPALVRQHEVTLFSQNPAIAAWGALFGCAFHKKTPGDTSHPLTGFDALIDDDWMTFRAHAPGARCYESLDAFCAEHPLQDQTSG